MTTIILLGISLVAGLFLGSFFTWWLLQRSLYLGFLRGELNAYSLCATLVPEDHPIRQFVADKEQELETLRRTGGITNGG